MVEGRCAISCHDASLLNRYIVLTVVLQGKSSFPGLFHALGKILYHCYTPVGYEQKTSKNCFESNQSFRFCKVKAMNKK